MRNGNEVSAIMNQKKNLIVIVGPNGIGKSSAAKSMLSCYPKSAFVDSDWCRVINPFPFTERTRETVIDNIYSLIRNYLLCRDIDYVIFIYGFHGERKVIFDEVLHRLEGEINFECSMIILKCSLDGNIQRLKSDGRDENRIKRGIDNTFHFYDRYDYPTIDTTELEIDQVADCIAEIVGIEGGYGAQGNFEGNRWSHDRGIISYAGAFDLWKKA